LTYMGDTTDCSADQIGSQSSRAYICPDPGTDRFFQTGRVVRRRDAKRVSLQITTQLGKRAATVRTRIHDLRHTFGVRH
jgi:hypothetical protein